MRYAVIVLCMAFIGSCAEITVKKPDVTEAVRKLSHETQDIDKQIQHNYTNILERLDSRYKQTSYELLVYNHTLVIAGRAFDEKMRKVAHEAATQVANTKRFFAYISIGGPLGVISSTNDLSKHAAFKSALITHSGIDASIVTSMVFESNLYLMGFITIQQANTVIDLATQIKGLNEIRVLFEYVEQDGTIIKYTDHAPLTQQQTSPKK